MPSHRAPEPAETELVDAATPSILVHRHGVDPIVLSLDEFTDTVVGDPALAYAIAVDLLDLEAVHLEQADDPLFTAAYLLHDRQALEQQVLGFGSPSY